MKKYIIQDVSDRFFLCEDDTWSEDARAALLFDTIQLGWDKAIEVHNKSGWILTVLPVIA